MKQRTQSSDDSTLLIKKIIEDSDSSAGIEYINLHRKSMKKMAKRFEMEYIAEDLIQDIIVAILTTDYLKKFRGGTNRELQSYIMTTFRNKLLLEKRHHMISLDDDRDFSVDSLKNCESPTYQKSIEDYLAASGIHGMDRELFLFKLDRVPSKEISAHLYAQFNTQLTVSQIDKKYQTLKKRVVKLVVSEQTMADRIEGMNR